MLRTKCRISRDLVICSNRERLIHIAVHCQHFVNGRDARLATFSHPSSRNSFSPVPRAAATISGDGARAMILSEIASFIVSNSYSPLRPRNPVLRQCSHPWPR